MPKTYPLEVANRDNGTTVPINPLPVLPPLPLVGFRFDLGELLDELRDKEPLTGGVVWPPRSPGPSS